ncbi:T7SS effector LXG polymorphic toxin [Listeria innocua]|uniref:T7SS effector LXG polymorphic toxin n=1 Tax=Listeria innocua TaxID=1642 RepID=UPI001FF7C8F0|nr:T7SS effector LXG polymorphic toxin [Listeria innocua]UPH47988.1 LXG domain-containing protein [Listeria innocua]
MSRIDIAELNHFLQGLRSSNAEAKKMIREIQQAASKYAQDKSLKGQAVSASQSYFTSSYPSIAQSILEALEESEERLAQYIREFGSQVDSSPSARIDAEILQEVMAKVAHLQRKEEDLHRQLTAPNTKPDMQQVYVVQARSTHTQLLQAIQKEDILERYIAFEQSHAQFFNALTELIHSTGRAVQELKQNVTFHEKTGTYAVPQSVHASISLMRKAMDKARKENAKDPFPEAFEDYQLFAYTYVNDKGETVTMWLLERDGKRASNKDLQAFLEKNGAELDPILYTNLSGEELERKVNDAWKDGVNYLNGQKVTGFSGATLRSSAYVASVKDAMDDAGLSEMALGLGFGIAAARNKSIIDGKTSSSKTKKGTINEQKNDYETEVFLPEEYYKNYRLPSRVEPGVKSLNKFDDLGNLKQTKFYDDYGREKGWIDYTNHGRPNSHSAPHWHEYIYNAEFPLGKKIDHRFDTNPPFNK